MVIHYYSFVRNRIFTFECLLSFFILAFRFIVRSKIEHWTMCNERSEIERNNWHQKHCNSLKIQKKCILQILMAQDWETLSSIWLHICKCKPNPKWGEKKTAYKNTIMRIISPCPYISIYWIGFGSSFIDRSFYFNFHRLLHCTLNGFTMSMHCHLKFMLMVGIRLGPN